MKGNKLFVIGHLSGLSPGLQTSVLARQVTRLEQADDVVAVCASDAWTEEEWSLLRQAHQEHWLPIFGTNGSGRRPPKPWPGSQWTYHGKGWFRLTNETNGYDPGDTEILFPNSVHRGKRLRECPLSYLDWLLAQDFLERTSFLHRMLRLYLERKPRCELAELEQEPFDTKGFCPSEARNKPSARALAFQRPPAQHQADDLLDNWDEAEGLKRKDRQQVLRGRRTRRVNRWDRLLLALDHIGAAEDEEDLQRKYCLTGHPHLPQCSQVSSPHPVHRICLVVTV